MEKFQRQIAYKTVIGNVLNSSYSKDEASSGSINLNGTDVSRVNIMAAVVMKEDGPNFNNLVIEDGSGKISLRMFENLDSYSKIDVGNVILTVGRIREYNGERYIIPEILKKIENTKWINVRKLELQNTFVESNPETISTDKKENNTDESNNTNVEEIVDSKANQEETKEIEKIESNQELEEEEKENPVEETKSSIEIVFELIKTTDSGEGADTDEIIKNSNIENCEQIVQKLLENGDVFEIKPGRLKVLE